MKQVALIIVSIITLASTSSAAHISIGDNVCNVASVIIGSDLKTVTVYCQESGLSAVIESPENLSEAKILSELILSFDPTVNVRMRKTTDGSFLPVIRLTK